MKFYQYTTQEVIQLLKKFKFTRSITQWHIHHTWNPNYSSFNGNNHQELQNGMRNYHMNVNKWSDFGAHFTLFPDAVWLSGRDLDKMPASILGWNEGALAVEMLGNFHTGKDQMTPAQRNAILEVTEFLVEEKSLIPRFHRDRPWTTQGCPGTGIDRDQFFKDMEQFTENKFLAHEPSIEKRKAKIVAAMEESDIRFSDLFDQNSRTAHWATKYINFLNDKKIIDGFVQKDGTQKIFPDKPATRAEVATMLAKTYESILEELSKYTKKL